MLNLESFDQRAIQNMSTLLKLAVAAGIKDIGKLEKIVANYTRLPAQSSKKCSCGGILRKYRVNISPCTMVGGGYKNVWICSTCNKETYTKAI